jgi:hypothetical protein
MTRKIGVTLGVVGLAAACVLVGSHIAMYAEAPAAGLTADCPLVLDMSEGISGETVNVQFVDEVHGVAGNQIVLTPEQKAKFRLALVTFKIRKPAGKRVSLAAADCTLHYYHADKAEVAPSEGISQFSASNGPDVERPMDLSRSMGPGFVKAITGAKATAADEVFVDVVFCFMEPDTNNCWMCVAQPLSKKPFTSQGWK